LYSEWHKLQDEAKASAPAYPTNRFSGRGIVVCAGGARFFTCAWVLLRVLREILKCSLPVQVWHMGPQEMDWRMSRLLEELGAEVIDAWRVGPPETRPSHGWPLKPFAILHSRFREVLLLDADNVPAVDPEQLFDAPPYRQTGALFWPDLDPLPPASPIWEICRVPYRAEPSFESGQVLIDKQRSCADADNADALLLNLGNAMGGEIHRLEKKLIVSREALKTAQVALLGHEKSNRDLEDATREAVVAVAGAIDNWP
jgi:hypothetical protein